MSHSGGEFAKVPVEQSYENVGVVFIRTTEDRLKNILREYTDILKKKKPLSAVFSTLVTVIAVIVTSEPNDDGCGSSSLAAQSVSPAAARQEAIGSVKAW